MADQWLEVCITELELEQGIHNRFFLHALKHFMDIRICYPHKVRSGCGCAWLWVRSVSGEVEGGYLDGGGGVHKFGWDSSYFVTHCNALLPLIYTFYTIYTSVSPERQ